MASVAGLRLSLIGALAGALAGVVALPALAQAPDCKALARRIADYDKRANSSLAERYERAARKQRDEIDRTVSYGEQSGCWTQIDGEAAPAMCRQLDARLARMRANLDDLDARAEEAGRSSWDGGQSREALVYDYETWCQTADAPARSGRIPLDRIPADESVRIDGETSPGGGGLYSPGTGATLSPGTGVDLRIPDISTPPGGDFDPTVSALCVRVCDGGYFPLTAPVRPGRTESLQQLCSAQCPGTEARVYTMRKGEDVSKAVALNGDFYAALPNAFKFRKKYDPACACKPAGKSWGQVLNEAEKVLQEQSGRTDSSSPAADLPKISAPPLRGGDAEGAARPRAAAPKGARSGAVESAPLAPPAPRAAAPAPAPVQPPKAEDGAEYREVVGADGVTRRIRIVGPKQ
jgi:hypothetical protein